MLPPIQPIKLDDAEITIGRMPDNKVVLPHPQVSGYHARMVRDGPESLGRQITGNLVGVLAPSDVDDVRASFGTFLQRAPQAAGQRTCQD